MMRSSWLATLVLSFVATLLPSVCLADEVAPLTPCSADATLAEHAVPWLPHDTKSNVCHLVVMTIAAPNAGLGAPFRQSTDHVIGAYSDSRFVAGRLAAIAEQGTGRDVMLDLSAGDVVESGSVGKPGELWWGRLRGGAATCCNVARQDPLGLNVGSLYAVNEGQSQFFVVGQETTGRLKRDPAAQMAIVKEMMATHRMPVPVKDAYAPWPKDAHQLRFEQVGATAAIDPQNGSDLRPPIITRPATISGGRLVLDVDDRLSGTLTMQVAHDLGNDTITIPLKRAVNEKNHNQYESAGEGEYRLRAGQDLGGAIQDCYVGDSGETLDVCKRKQMSSTGLYLGTRDWAARGVFFGPRGEYLAIRYSAWAGERMTFDGVVILQRVAP